MPDNDSAHVNKLPYQKRLLYLFLLTQCLLPACAADTTTKVPFEVTSTAGSQPTAVPLGSFDQPWAMTFLPDGDLLVTEKPGNLWLLHFDVSESSAESMENSVQSTDQDSGALVVSRSAVDGLPNINAGGQGGLGGVVLHPEFGTNDLVYVSYVERDGDLSGAVVARARLERTSVPTPLGIAFDQTGQLWVHEMGPRGGDDFLYVLEDKAGGRLIRMLP